MSIRKFHEIKNVKRKRLCIDIDSESKKLKVEQMRQVVWIW